MPALIQPFPKKGVLFENLNLARSDLARRIGGAGQPAYSYVVKSVKIDRTTCGLEQHGSAPNFQGGILTLCTCKHQMRSSLSSPQWKHKWIAAFTSRCLHQGLHWLFYLTQISDAQESHADLWDSLPAAVRDAKAAHDHFLGDLFVPRDDVAGDARFLPHRYFAPPRHSHRRHKCDNGWHNDIRYKHADRYGHPPLLVGDPQLTFLWKEPLIYFDDLHCRNFKKWECVTELLEHLRCGAS